MPYIEKIHALQVLDSRGFPTIQATVTLQCGVSASAIVPSGASTGKFEAIELRDQDQNRYGGKSVFKAIHHINDGIDKLLKGQSVFDQRHLDAMMIELDGTENKSKLGANAILAVSLAIARCASVYLDLPLYQYLGGLNGHRLPIPMINVLNGGVHAFNGLAFQEFMIVPHGAHCFSEAMEWSTQIFHHLKTIIEDHHLSSGVGDEGGFAPDIKSHHEAIGFLLEAIESVGLKPGEDVSLALDVAASEFYHDGYYHLENKALSSQEMIDYLIDLVSFYPIISIEDGLDQEDYQGWKELYQKLSSSIQLVGDDLFVTNTSRLQMGIDDKLANSILIKLNQIGTLSETMDCIELAKNNHINPIISHRSGESEDTFIADLSVAINAPYIKTGSLSRSERICKYNRLFNIETEL